MPPKGKIDKITKLTANILSQPSQSGMLNFIEIRKEEKQKGMRQNELMPIPEKWIQTEIVRGFYKQKFKVEPREEKKKKGHDFKIDDVSIGLKASSSFKYKEEHNRLLNEIRRKKKHPDCWMFVTVYDENKYNEMLREPELSNFYLNWKKYKRQNQNGA